MKYKTTIFILLSIILVGVFILVRYGLFIVYWLTTPNALERTDVEKQLIEHFETRSKLDAIELKPRFKYYITCNISVPIMQIISMSAKEITGNKRKDIFN